MGVYIFFFVSEKWKCLIFNFQSAQWTRQSII